MLDITNPEYNGNKISIETTKTGERYWNLQSMADACSSTKRVRSWVNLDTTAEYITALRKYYAGNDKKNDITFEPILGKKGNRSDGSQGTWIHEELAVAAARWLDASFSVWCDQTMKSYSKDSFVVSDKISESRIAKLDRKIQKLVNTNKALRATDRKLFHEHEAHKVYSFAYHLVKRPGLTVEYNYGGRKFDFFEERTDRLVITELKADSVTTDSIEEELVGKKSYYQVALNLHKQDKKSRVVRLKFLCPSFTEMDSTIQYLTSMKTDGIEFELETWHAELQYLRDKHLLKYGNVKQTDRDFNKLRQRLDEIWINRGTVI